MKTWRRLSNSVLVFAAISLCSCQDWNRWDEPAGGQTQPEPEPPTVDASYANVSSPTLAKDGAHYYIISSNATIEGIDSKSGLMFRKTADLVNFEGMTDENAYILSDVISSWAGERLKTLNPAVNDEQITLVEPSLRKVGDTWRLYYAVSSGTNTSVIGYATAESAEGPWIDKGEVLYSSQSTEHNAAAPSFFTSADGSQHFLAYGKGSKGIFITELDAVTGSTQGTSKKVAARTSGATVENATVFYYGGYYHMMFTHRTDVWSTVHVAATEPMGDYMDVANRSAIFDNQWALTRVLNDFQLIGGDRWSTITGADVLLDGDEGFIVHQAQVGNSTPVMHVRQLHWVKDTRRVQRPDLPLVAISPEEYRGYIAQPAITPELIAGAWNYGTLWAHVNSGISDQKMFNADGTYSGGSWDFNPGTNVLHLHSTEWGGEQIYLYLYLETDNVNGGTALVASGYNDTFGDHPGAWMKKVGSTSGGGSGDLDARMGIFNPTVAQQGSLYYVFSGNAAHEELEYNKGLLLQSTTDFAFIDPVGYVLDEVVDGWAQGALRELDETITEEAQFTIDYPSIKKSGTTWRLFYSVTASESSAAVIGYAESNNLASGWADKGMVLSSNTESAYRAVAPSYCVSPYGDYLAFGHGDESTGIFVVSLDAAMQPETEPIRVLRFFQSDGILDRPELAFHDNRYHLLVNNNGMYNYEYSAANATGPYVNRSKDHNTIEGMFWNGRTMVPYFFPGEKVWSALGGISLYQNAGRVLAVHQAAQEGEAPELHVREAFWFTVPVENIQSPFLVVSPYIIDDSLIDQKVAESELLNTQWLYGTAFRHVPLSEMSTEFILNADHTLGGAPEGTWSYDPETQYLNMILSSWGGERIFMRVLRTVDEKGKGMLSATGINADFDKTSVWMRQVKQ